MNYIANLLKKLSHFICLIIFFAFFLSSCDYEEMKSKATTGELKIEVDETFKPVMEELKKEFERLNPEAKLSVSYLPTNNLVVDLLNKDVNTIVMAGDFDDSTKKWISKYKIEVQKYEVCFDGVAFIVNPENPTTRLTKEELKNIFNGTYSKWTDIKSQDDIQNKEVQQKMKGNDDNIKIFIPRPNSSLNGFVKDSVLLGSEYSKSAVMCTTSVQMLEEVRKYRNAIGVSNMASLSKGGMENLDSTVKAVKVANFFKFVDFHIGTIANQTYPYFRRIYIFSTEAGISLTTGFVSFMRGRDGQKVMIDYGLVPGKNTGIRIQLED
jgi:phosphate transport system substrate-binding protein